MNYIETILGIWYTSRHVAMVAKFLDDNKAENVT